MKSKMRILPILLMTTAVSTAFFSCDDDEEYVYNAIEVTGNWKESGDMGHTLYALNADGTVSASVYETDIEGNTAWGNTTFSQYVYTDGDGMILIKNKVADPDSGDKSFYSNDTLYVKHITTEPVLSILDASNKTHNWGRTDETVDRSQMLLGTWKKNDWGGVTVRTFAADGTGKEVYYDGQTGQPVEKTFNYTEVSAAGTLTLNYGGETTKVALYNADDRQILAAEMPADGEEHTYVWVKADTEVPEFTYTVAATWKEMTAGGDAIIRTFGPNGKFREHSFVGNVIASETTYDYTHGNGDALVAEQKIGEMVIPMSYTIKTISSDAATVMDMSEMEMKWTKVNHGYEKLIGTWNYEYSVIKQVEVEVDKVDENGVPVRDENGLPVKETQLVDEKEDFVKTYTFNMDETGLYTDETGLDFDMDKFTFVNGKISMLMKDGSKDVWTPTSINKTRLVVTNAAGDSMTLKRVEE